MDINNNNRAYFVGQFTEIQIRHAHLSLQEERGGINEDTDFEKTLIISEIVAKVTGMLNSSMSNIDRKKILIRFTPEELETIHYQLNPETQAKMDTILATVLDGQVVKPKKMFIDKAMMIARASKGYFDNKFYDLYTKKNALRNNSDVNQDIGQSIRNNRRWVELSNLSPEDKAEIFKTNYALGKANKFANQLAVVPVPEVPKAPVAKHPGKAAPAVRVIPKQIPKPSAKQPSRFVAPPRMAPLPRPLPPIPKNAPVLPTLDFSQIKPIPVPVLSHSNNMPKPVVEKSEDKELRNAIETLMNLSIDKGMSDQEKKEFILATIAEDTLAMALSLMDEKAAADVYQILYA